MKVLDRYLTRELLIPLFYATLALIFLVLIADVFDNLEDILRNNVPLTVAARYYLCLSPYVFIQILPWATWVATLFLLVTLGLHHEITAMKIAGLKITTIVRPILFVGFLIGIIAFLVGDRILPPSYRLATDLRKIYIEKKEEPADEKKLANVTYYADANRIYYFREFLPHAGKVSNAIVLWFDTAEHQTRQKMVAAEGIWTGDHWNFRDVTEYQIDSRGRILGEPRHFTEKAYRDIRVSPPDLLNASSDSSFLSYRELKRLITQLRQNGAKVSSELVDLHYRLAVPWQGLVMMLITIPLLGQTTTRRGIALKVLICIGLILAYHVSGALLTALGKAGKLFPFLSAWGPHILFAFGAVVNLEKANY